MPESKCPNHEMLQGFHLGTLPEDSAEAMIEHVATCSHCQALLETFCHVSNTVVACLRSAAVADPYAEEPHCQQALARIKAVTAGALAGRGSVAMVPPRQLGEYELIEKLGEGGMGAVYKARQTNLDRVVALKVLPRSRMRNERSVARFYREMKAVGRLDHPNIVQAFDAREIEDTPVLAMEYVRGLTLSALVGRLGPLPVGDACELIRQAALGLQAAHECDLVHRDLKPSNLMLTPDGTLKILDLGLALLQSPGNVDEEPTGSGQAMGTADYMAPEQTLDSHEVDIRADIYSLGCTLFKLLTGRAPFGGPEYPGQMAKMMAHVQEPSPSIAGQRDDVPEGLVQVLDRMLAKAPGERYATPAEMAEAMAEFAASSNLQALASAGLDSEIRTRQPDPSRASTEECRSSALIGTHPQRRSPYAPAPESRGLRRYSRFIAVAAALAGVFVLAIVLTLSNGDGTLVIQAKDPQIRVAVEQAGQQVAIVDAESGWSIELRPGEYKLSLAGGPDQFHIERDVIRVTRRGEVRVKVTRKEDADEAHKKAIARGDAVAPLVKTARGPVRIVPEPVPEIKPGEPLSKIALVAEPVPIEGVRSWTLETIGHRGSINEVEYSPDDSLLATACEDGAVRLWNPTTARLVRALLGHDGPVNSLSWSPDGKVLATAGSDRTVRLWDIQSGLVLRMLRGHTAQVRSVDWSPTGDVLASGAWDDTVRVWDTKWCETLHVLRDPSRGSHIEDVAWSPDGKRLAWGGDPYVWVSLWERALEKQRTIARDKCVRKICWSPDGRLTVCPGNPGLWDPEVSEWSESPWGHRDIGSLAWSPDGTTLASGKDLANGWVSVWNTKTWQLRYEHGEHGDDANRFPTARFPTSLTFSCDGSALAVGNSVGTLRLWDGSSGNTVQSVSEHTGSVGGLAFSPHGEVLTSGHGDSVVRFWDIESGRLLEEFPWDHNRNSIGCVAWSADGKLAVNRQPYDMPVIWDFRARSIRKSDSEKAAPKVVRLHWKGHYSIHALDTFAWSPDANALATGGKPCRDPNNAVSKLWDAATGEFLGDLPARGNGLAYSGDGKTLALGAGSEVKLCDAETLEFHQSLCGPEASLNVLASSHDDKLLAGGGEDKKVYVWDVSSGQLLATLGDHESKVLSLCWLDDGTSLASGSCTETCVWDTRQKKLLREIKDRADVFSPDGRLTAAAGASMVRLRRLEDGQLLRTLVALREGQHAVVSPEGHWQGAPRVRLEEEFVYVVQTDEGQATLTPDEFERQYGWKNDPAKVGTTAEEPKQDR